MLGNAEKLRPESWLPGAGSAVSDIMAARETAAHLVTEFAGRARAFVQVQQGCDHRCTFCIIPFGRGPNRSRADRRDRRPGRARWSPRGYQEVVLTGVDIAAYGADLPGAPSLGQMVRRLLALVPELPRLRLSSLDPAAIDDDLWRLIAEEPRLMPHLHLSLQAGGDLILKRMQRRHSRAEAHGGDRPGPRPAAGHRHRRRPDRRLPDRDRRAVRRDPATSCAEAALPYLHVFPYSERPGTPAARMPPRAEAGPQGARRALREAGGDRGRPLLRRPDRRTSSSVADRSGAVGPFRTFRPGAPDAAAAAGPADAARVTGATMAHAAGGGGLMALGGFFSRLKEGLSRSTQKLTGGITAVFTQAPAGRRGAGGAGGAADRGRPRHRRSRRSVIAAFRRTRFGKEVTDEEIKQALAEEIAAILAPVAKPLELDPALQAACGAGGRRQRHRQDHDHRQAGAAISTSRASASCMAAGDTFRAAAVEQLQIWGERTGAPVIAGGAERGCRRPRVRCADQGAEPTAPTCC